MARRRKIRIDLRKNRSKPPRERGWTREYQAGGGDDMSSTERVRAKGDLSRKRTIIAEDTNPAGPETTEAVMPAADLSECLPGRVARVHGQHNIVVTDDGREYACAVRRLLRTIAIEERNVVTTGDRVWFRPAPGNEGLIEKVEPRYGLLTRRSWKREHVLVANVDQIVIVAALAEPFLKPHLVDRYLVAASMGSLRPIICFNKADLVDPADFQQILGLYAQLDIAVVLTSIHTGQGLDALREELRDRQTVIAGQSGVGKTSLLNAIQPGLRLKVREVSGMNQKGRHTTTTAELIKLESGGWVVDTPGIRQFDLWNVIPEELDGHFPEFHPFVAHCGFPGCSHLHEDNCAVRAALHEGWIDPQRYYSYRGIYLTKENSER